MCLWIIFMLPESTVLAGQQAILWPSPSIIANLPHNLMHEYGTLRDKSLPHDIVSRDSYYPESAPRNKKSRHLTSTTQRIDVQGNDYSLRVIWIIENFRWLNDDIIPSSAVPSS